MKSQIKSPGSKKRILLVILLVVCLLFFLNIFKINKFEFTGDLKYVDLQILKIVSLNLLKDQPIFWFDRQNFETSLRSQMPQIKQVNYKVLSSDTLEINLLAEDICCVVQDANEKLYILSSEGEIKRAVNEKVNINQKIIVNQVLNLNDRFDKKIVDVLKSVLSTDVKIEDIKGSQFFLEKEYIYYNTLDSKQVIINEDTNINKLNADLKSIKSYLEQNQKSYSILDFRFEKIIVK